MKVDAPIPKLTCRQCGGSFDCWNKLVRYCSPECRRERDRIAMRAQSKKRRVSMSCVIPLGELGTVTGRIVGRPMDYLGELCVPVVLTHQLDREPDWWPIGCVEVVEDEWA